MGIHRGITGLQGFIFIIVKPAHFAEQRKTRSAENALLVFFLNA